MGWLEDLIGPTPDSGGFEDWVPDLSFDDALNWGAQSISDVGSSLYGAIADPFQREIPEFQQNMFEALKSDPYSLERLRKAAGVLGESGYDVGSGIVNNLFATAQHPVNIAANYYSGLEGADPISELGGGSLRDLAEAGMSIPTGPFTSATLPQVTDPYKLETIEKFGGEALEELSDPTNIPGALVGAGRLIGRGASNLDKILAGAGAISGFSGGIPALGSGVSSAMDEGLTPESYGKMLEGGMGVLFGGLSTLGLTTGTGPIIDPNVSSQFNPLASGERGSIEFGPKPDVPIIPESIIPDEQVKPLNRPSVEMMKVKDLDPYLEYDRAVAPDERYNTLLESIRNEGIQEPLTLDLIEGEPRLAEGNRRAAIAKQLGIGEVPVEALTDEMQFVKPSELLETVKSPEPIESLVPETPQIERRIETAEPKVTEPDTTELSSYVDSLKDKYGDRWRKEMDKAESDKFNSLQQELLYANMAKEFETPKRRASDLTVSDILKMEEAEPYTKAQIEANFPDRTQEVQASPDVTQPIDIVKPEQIIPPAPPEIIKGEPPPPSQPSKKLRLTPLSKFEKIVKPAEANIAKANPIIGEAEKQYRQFHEVEASKSIGEIEGVIKGIDKASESRIVRFLDGENVVLTPKESNVAKSLRSVLDRIAEQAKDSDVITGYRKNYFTHINENITEKQTSPFFGAELVDKPYGKLEKGRTKEDSNIVRSFDVLKQYADKATRRIAEAKFLGKGLEKIKNVTGDPATVGYVERYFKALTGREKSGPVAKTLSGLRRITALGDLGLTSILQAGQGVHTTSYVGLRRSIRAAVAGLKDIPGESLKALQSGALWPNISHEVGVALGGGGKGFKGYMHGVPTVDKAMRIHANIAGRLLLEDARKGNEFAKNQLIRAGIKDFNSPDAANLAGKLISDKTQFRSDISHLPSWATTPAGRLAFQYSSFAYRQTQFMMDAFKNPIKNFGQIARMAGIGGLIAGEIIGDTRAMVKAAIPGKGEDDNLWRRMLEAAFTNPDNFDSKSWLEKLQAVTGSRRIPTNSPGWRVLQNLSLVGGIGIFQSILEKMADPKRYMELPIGPGGTMLAETGIALGKDIQKGNIRESSRNLIQNIPIPFVDKYKLANTLLPPKRRRRSSR